MGLRELFAKAKERIAEAPERRIRRFREKEIRKREILRTKTRRGQQEAELAKLRLEKVKLREQENMLKLKTQEKRFNLMQKRAKAMPQIPSMFGSPSKSVSPPSLWTPIPRRGR